MRSKNEVHGDSGSALILVPAAVLILVVLGAITLDSATVFLGQRQLAHAAANAATDAAGSALANASFYDRGQILIDPASARNVAEASIAAQHLSGVHIQQPIVVKTTGRQVCVSLVGRVSAIFGLAIPGASRSTLVRAEAVATAAGDTPEELPRAKLC